MKTVILSAMIIVLGQFSLLAQSVKDLDGNTYKTVVIGNQIWMAENLKVTKFNDGTPIKLIEKNELWSSNSHTLSPKPAYCWPDNDLKNKNIYGALYNGYTFRDGNICPVGWHVSSDEDWHILVKFLDPDATLDIEESKIAGNLLKESGTSHWTDSNPEVWGSVPTENVTNSSAFTALPGGIRNYDGSIYGLGYYSVWWSVNMEGEHNDFSRTMDSNYGHITRSKGMRNYGYAVRCVKDK